MADAFAVPTDVSNTWRPLVGTETGWAQVLLDAAALWIRGRKPGILDDDPAAHIVSILVVRDALQRGAYVKFAGQTSGTITIGPRTESWAAPSTATLQQLAESLIFTEYHLNLLGLWRKLTPTYAFGSAGRGVDPIRIVGRRDLDL